MDNLKRIYVAGPLGPMGGGMLRVTDYLMQAQDSLACYDHAKMVKLDTRGTGNAVSSIWVLAKALGKIVGSRASGRLAGVHVNMAERLSVFRKGILLGLCKLLGVPTVLHLHAAQMEAYYRSISPLSRFLTKRVFQLASHVIVLGENARAFVIRDIGLPASRVDVVINGVPRPQVARRDAAAVTRKKVLFLGNLWERKGVADLFKAVANPAFDPARCEVVIAGGGDVQTYKDQATRLSLNELVTFAGWVDQDRAAAILASADLLVLPSYDEGLPLVILEALAQGVAVVCTPVGEIAHVLTDGVDAFFITPGDVPGIGKALLAVLGDAALQARLETNGRKVYEEKFSLERFSGRVATIHDATFGLTSATASPRQARV